VWIRHRYFTALSAKTKPDSYTVESFIPSSRIRVKWRYGMVFLSVCTKKQSRNRENRDMDGVLMELYPVVCSMILLFTVSASWENAFCYFYPKQHYFFYFIFHLNKVEGVCCCKISLHGWCSMFWNNYAWKHFLQIIEV
jgi:hypothetical protein